ncbi:MAG: hypothetical protein DRJ61_00915 [Acidobacteria bacterium]|nr:MAG: hypothetical protein DRJ61_00915 [Acidobacteriota bacterium]
MNWKTLFSTPPPDTVWSLDGQKLVVVHRDRKTGDRCAAVAVPEGVFHLGVAGLQSVDEQRLTGLLTSLQETINGVRRVAVVIPTHWVRCFLMEAGELPRRRADLQDVLRWRLKKLLPIAPADLRIAASIQSFGGDQQQVLCSTMSETAIAHLESAFEGAGISPGLVVPRVYAFVLEPASLAVHRVIVQQEDSLLSMAVVTDGGVRFIRTKPLPQSGGSWQGVEREIALAMSYIRTTMAIDGDIEAVVSASEEATVRSIAGLLERQPGVAVRIPDARQICPDVNLASTLGSARLAPMAAVLNGGAP